jgi:hypothetical protein
MEQAGFSAAFRKSPVERAKLAGLQRNARVVLDGTLTAQRLKARHGPVRIAPARRAIRMFASSCCAP